jgi:hypothetical protein
VVKPSFLENAFGDASQKLDKRKELQGKDRCIRRDMII